MSDFAIIKDMPAVEAAINEESWEWLVDNVPVLADAIHAEITTRNATSIMIKRFVMQATQRDRLAARCYQAACYIEELEKKK